MAYRKKNALPFDREGGVTTIQRRLLESEAYSNLSAQAKALISLMQIHWLNTKPVAYGIREAMRKIPCAKLTARAAFDQLVEEGFIEMIDESLFDSRAKSKTRTWRLTWLPYMWKAPTNEWETKRSNRIESVPASQVTGLKMNPPEDAKIPQGHICTLKAAKSSVF